MAEREDSDELKPRRTGGEEYWQVKWKLRTFEQWREDVNKDRKELEKRIRELEDFVLTSRAIHRNMIKWVTISSGAFAAAISLLEHLLFK